MILVTPVASRAAQTPGEWWAALSAQNQEFAVAIAIDSYEQGWYAGEATVATEMPNGATLARQVTQQHGGEVTYSHTYRFYASAVSDFYSTHPDRSDINLGRIVACLADVPIFTCTQLAQSKGP